MGTLQSLVCVITEGWSADSNHCLCDLGVTTISNKGCKL